MNILKSVAIELNVIIKNGNYSFLKMNRVIHRYSCEIRTMPLDEFERKYREVFGLGSFSNQVQQYPTSLIQPNGQISSVYITEEFYNALLLNYAGNKTLFETGYFTFLKSKKSVFLQNQSDCVDTGIVTQDIEKLRHFTERLGNSLRLARYDSFEFDLHFAYIPKEKKVVPFHAGNHQYLLKNEGMKFMEKDNYLIQILLNNEKKMSDYISLALRNFEESLHIRNYQLRFVQLLSCLEICFANARNEPNMHILARHSSLLLAGNKNEFRKFYDEVIKLCSIKMDILYGNVFYKSKNDGMENDLYAEIVRAEELIRNILKKIIRMNIPTREKLFYELNAKAVPS